MRSKPLSIQLKATKNTLQTFLICVVIIIAGACVLLQNSHTSMSYTLNLEVQKNATLRQQLAYKEASVATLEAHDVLIKLGEPYTISMTTRPKYYVVKPQELAYNE